MQQQTLDLFSNHHQVVFRAGDSDRPPIVWLHSLYGVEADAPIIDAFAKSYSVYAPLTPGFADLEELDAIRDIHDLALHYDDILEALDLPTAMVAGHSLGAMIGAELAAHVPRRVSRLVLASPLGLWNEDHPVADIFGVPATEMATLLYSDLSNAPGGPSTTDIEAVVALARGMATAARFLWPIPDRGLSRRLHRVNAPTLIIHGAEDRFVPAAYAPDFAERLPNPSVQIIPGIGHMLFGEAFDAAIKVVDVFLQQEKVEAHA